MDRSDIEDDTEEGEIDTEENDERVPAESTINPNPLSQLDFYQADPFVHCQSDRMYSATSYMPALIIRLPSFSLQICL